MLHTKSSIFKPITEALASTFSTSSVGCLRVKRHKDPVMDQAISNDREWRTVGRVVRHILSEPDQTIAIPIFEKRRKKLGFFGRVGSFVSKYPGLFETFRKRVRPRSGWTPFVRPGPMLWAFLEERDLIYRKNEEWVVCKLCKLLMMSRHRVLRFTTLEEVKRDFGIPNDFMEDLVPRHPEYFQVTEGEGKVEGQRERYLGLVKWNEEYGKSVIELRAEKESRRIGIRVRPSFDWKLPSWVLYKKEMVEWIRDWMELPYISPYGEEGWKLDSASREAEKRMIGVLHELLSLTVHKRMTVDVMGRFCDYYNFSNGFSKAFTRHQGLFYVSLKGGGYKTIYLREAYRGPDLVDRSDPLLEISEKFSKMVEESKNQFSEMEKLKRQTLLKEKEEMAREPEIVFFDSD